MESTQNSPTLIEDASEEADGQYRGATRRRTVCDVFGALAALCGARHGDGNLILREAGGHVELRAVLPHGEHVITKLPVRPASSTSVVGVPLFDQPAYPAYPEGHGELQKMIEEYAREIAKMDPDVFASEYGVRRDHSLRSAYTSLRKVMYDHKRI